MHWLTEEQVNFMDWPANSPDLNCIENVWGTVKQFLAKLTPSTVAIWKEIIFLLWEELSIDYMQKLVDSIPRRIEGCIKAKGGRTNY